MEENLDAADHRFQRQDWAKAATLYREALARLSAENRLLQAKVTERLAKCLCYSAFQADDREDFLRIIGQAKAFYENAARNYEVTGHQQDALKCTARVLFARFWTEESFQNRKNIMEKCIEISNEALRRTPLEETERHALLQSDILTYYSESLRLSAEGDKRLDEFGKAVDIGKTAINELEASHDYTSFLEALHSILWILAVGAETVIDSRSFMQLAPEVMQLKEKLEHLSEKVKTPFAMSLAKEAAGDIAWDLEGNLAKAMTSYREALEFGRLTHDSIIVGRLLANLAGLQRWQAMGMDGLEDRRKLIEESIELGEEGLDKLSICRHSSYLSRVQSNLAECYIDLAQVGETDRATKIDRLNQAVSLASAGMIHESFTDEWVYSVHNKARAMYLLSTMSANTDDKRRLLAGALPLREQAVQAIDELQPHSWNRGVMRNHLALVKAELSTTESRDNGGKLLQEAIAHMDECIETCEKWATTVPGSALRLARYYESYGDILRQYYVATLQEEFASRSTRAYGRAMEYLDMAGQIGTKPAIRWKVAKLFDTLAKFDEASQNFTKAAEEYRAASTKIPGTASTFQGLANYMEAWSDIEEARLCHDKEDHEGASENYSNAAHCLQTARQGSYLSKLVLARSILEKAEVSSYSEDHIRAAKSLKKTLMLFEEAKADIEKAIINAPEPRESQEAQEWLKIADHRETYAQARLLIEEARILDKKGDKNTSATKFEAAAVAFKALVGKTSGPREQSETETLSQFCDCWARMKEAESKASPELFAETAHQFEAVSNTTERSTFRLMALANSSICRALEQGTRFRITRNIELYSEIKKQLETAADYFTEAGLRKTASWTRATQKLFDALILLAEAETTRDLRKKTELVQIAERHFELSAKLYGEAGFSTKKKEALDRLKLVREEKEVLTAPLDALAEIPTVSTSQIASIRLTGGPAPDLGKFEQAHVVGEVTTADTVLTIGKFLSAIVDVVNIGRTAATLIKMENVRPDGFEYSTVEKGTDLGVIDLKGKRLEHLKTHQVKLSLRAARRGTFDISPRVVFVDDQGNYRSTVFQSRIITIKEPGLSEESAIPPKIRVPVDIKFENKNSREVFQFFVKEFMEDYMSKRIVVERAGWRSLTTVIQKLGIPRSAMYRAGGRKGPALQELESRGFVETRIFPGERGRGGNIQRARVAYENAIVRSVVEQSVRENT